MAEKQNIFQRAFYAMFGVPETLVVHRPQKEARYGGGNHIMSVSYNGSKDMGDMGPPIDYTLDYDTLRYRSWQSYLESDLVRTIINKYSLSIIGSGLKLQTKPNKQVLASEGIDLDAEEFNEVAESRFAVWKESRMSSRSGMENLSQLEDTAFKNSNLGGDVLTILSVVKGVLKVQLVDGQHVCSPFYSSDSYTNVLASGNVIRNGIELSPTGEHIAYWVRTKEKPLDCERILARSKTTGLLQAYLVYGMRHRLDNHRGIPRVSSVLATVAKLDRYTGATLGTAEETAKLTFQVTHKRGSTGENVFATQGLAHAQKSFNADAVVDDLPTTVEGDALADKVFATTGKQTFNMPIESEIKPMNQSNGTLYFKEFFETNRDSICSAIGIPPNVAMSIYNDSYSASRAAIKDWELTIKVCRYFFAFQFLNPIWAMFLHLEVLKNKITAPGYLKAYLDGNEMVLEAYRSARFTGPMPGHIDPLKEVKALREALGESFNHMPLISMEDAAEQLFGSDADSIMEQAADELKEGATLGFKPEVKQPTTTTKKKEEVVEGA